MDLISRPDTPRGREALDQLLRRYLPALRAYLTRKGRINRAEAEELLQDFVTAKIMEQGVISRADRAKGKFRTFLLTALNNYVIDYLRHKRRHPSQRLVDDVVSRLSDDPSDVFDLEWARQVVDTAIQRMRSECDGKQRRDLWGVFEARILNPMLHGAEPLSYDELVGRFALPSPSAAANALVSAKRMFIRNLRSVIGEYAQGEEQIAEEIGQLRAALARGGTRPA